MMNSRCLPIVERLGETWHEYLFSLYPITEDTHIKAIPPEQVREGHYYYSIPSGVQVGSEFPINGVLGIHAKVPDTETVKFTLHVNPQTGEQLYLAYRHKGNIVFVLNEEEIPSNSGR